MSRMIGSSREARSSTTPSTPVVVSFHAGDDYYRAAATLLRDDCARLGLDHDIVEKSGSPDADWLSICRWKVSFYLEMHLKHQRPVLWLDVDSRLGSHPAIFDGASCDVAGFLRGFRYLPEFDPVSAPRFFAPFALYFNFTPEVTAFLELMAELERAFTGHASDDFFLQEAWKQHRLQLSVMVLPPDLVGREWPLRDRQFLYVGLSGNVTRFQSNAQQHVAEVLAPARRKAVMVHEAKRLSKERRAGDALLLYERALKIEPRDRAIARNVAALLRQEGRPADAEAFLRSHEAGTPRIKRASGSSVPWGRLRSLGGRLRKQLSAAATVGRKPDRTVDVRAGRMGASLREPRGESKALAHPAYWQKRKDSVYICAARLICRKYCPKPRAVIDVGSNACPTLEWHRGAGVHLVSLDLRNPYVSPGVESITSDFLRYEASGKFDLATCFQVLEHVRDPAAFATKLMRIADVVVVSVPYKWKKGKCRFHVHDPVDEKKMLAWFGRKPDYSYIAREISKDARLVNVYKQ